MPAYSAWENVRGDSSQLGPTEADILRSMYVVHCLDKDS
jgi:hypothetical protein